MEVYSLLMKYTDFIADYYKAYLLVLRYTLLLGNNINSNKVDPFTVCAASVPVDRLMMNANGWSKGADGP